MMTLVSLLCSYLTLLNAVLYHSLSLQTTPQQFSASKSTLAQPSFSQYSKTVLSHNQCSSTAQPIAGLQDCPQRQPVLQHVF